MSIPDCEFQLRPSRVHVLLSIILHVGAMAALWASRVPIPLAAALSGILLAGMVRDVWVTGLRRGRRAVREVRVRGGRLALCLNDGTVVEPAGLRSAWLLDAIVLLRLAGRPCGHSVVVVPADAVAPEALRRLRIAVGAALDAREPAPGD